MGRDYWDGMVRGVQFGSVSMAAAHMFDHERYLFALPFTALALVIILREIVEHRALKSRGRGI